MTLNSPGGQPYPITLVWDQSSDGASGWVAAIDALPGCVSQGETPKEAVENLAEVAEDWIAVAQKRGTPIPEPRTSDQYSGRFLVRAPSSLHERLVQEAAAEGTSLNQFVTNALAGAVGWGVPRSSFTTFDAASYSAALEKAARHLAETEAAVRFVDLTTGDAVEAPAVVELAESKTS